VWFAVFAAFILQKLMIEAVDFFKSTYGAYEAHRWRGRRASLIKDSLFNMRLLLNPNFWKAGRNIAHAPVRNILVMGVEVPSRAGDLKNVMRDIANSRHRVSTITAPFHEGLGKFQNINRALARVDITQFDWFIIVDDDIALPEAFLDRFIALSERADLNICMPAHCFRSHQTFEITLRKWNSLARLTHFVEGGPMTAFRNCLFGPLLPFPELRWGWGTDLLWSEYARLHRYPIGVVDATPIRHLRPVAASYDWQAAGDEATAFLQQKGFSRTKREILQTIKTFEKL
jgi:hypothetical protein